jgi:hypothetical protein
METRRETRSQARVPPEHDRIREVCFTFASYKLTAAELAVLTRLPVSTVERAMVELSLASELPLQYLERQLS